MTVRCKFECTMATKVKAWNKDQGPFLYGYKMQVVTGDTPENKQFFASTPSGSFEISAVRDDLFEPGKKYFIDITPADQPA